MISQQIYMFYAFLWFINITWISLAVISRLQLVFLVVRYLNTLFHLFAHCTGIENYITRTYTTQSTGENSLLQSTLSLFPNIFQKRIIWKSYHRLQRANSSVSLKYKIITRIRSRKLGIKNENEKSPIEIIIYCKA